MAKSNILTAAALSSAFVLVACGGNTDTTPLDQTYDSSVIESGVVGTLYVSDGDDIAVVEDAAVAVENSEEAMKDEMMAKEEAAAKEAAEAAAAAAAAAAAKAEAMAKEDKMAMAMAALLETTTVYFEYDSAAIDSQFVEVLDAHAKYLVANPNQMVVLEGHADERGTREYNLGLGENRAKQVSTYLQIKGVSAAQIDTVSYGEEKPAAMGSSVAAYAENRRVKVVYK